MLLIILSDFVFVFSFVSHSSEFIGKTKRVHERIDPLTNLAQFDEVFWTNKSKAAIVEKFQDWVQ
jgi:hypothetical protein